MTTSGHTGLVQPFILPHRKFDRMDVDDVRDPIRTIDASNGGNVALVDPQLLQLTHGGRNLSSDKPLPTVTTAKRGEVALVQSRTGSGMLVNSGGRQVLVDVLFRMLQPHELAAAMGFPADYKITGNKGEQVKQVGNAWSVEQAEALGRPFFH